jgi:hypothetical protein
MADALGYINSFTGDLENNQDKWHTYVIAPFDQAYRDAFTNFNLFLKKQKESEAPPSWLLPLCMLALSLCAGGVLTASFGAVTAKALAGKAASSIAQGPGLDFIVRHNMERAFRAANFLANNKTGNFIAGKLWDSMESGVSSYTSDQFKKAKSAIIENASTFPSIEMLVQDPMKVEKALIKYVDEAKIKCHDIAAAIRDSASITDEAKILSVSLMRLAPICNPPQSSIAYDGLAGEIEMAFYLNLVTNLDYLASDFREELMETRGAGWRRTGYYTPNKITPIEVSPDDNNPKSTPGKAGPQSQRVGFKGFPKVLSARLDELHKKKFRTPFNANPVSENTIRLAEKTISSLANGNIKRLISGAA